MLRLLLNRPFLLVGILVGVAIYLATWPWISRGVARALIAWDSGVVTFFCLTYVFVRRTGVEEVKRRIIEFRMGTHYVLVATILASIASVGVMATELARTRTQPGAVFPIVLSAVSICLSWLLVQIVFALRYAHVYYSAQANGCRNCGLNFGEMGEPEFGDFLDFSIVIGTADQTADIAFTSREMRRIGTLHTLVAFGFNTAILATMINIAAGIF